MRSKRLSENSIVVVRSANQRISNAANCHISYIKTLVRGANHDFSDRSVSHTLQSNVPMVWTQASGGCQSPDYCGSNSNSQGTYVPRSPNEFPASAPLVHATVGLAAGCPVDHVTQRHQVLWIRKDRSDLQCSHVQTLDRQFHEILESCDDQRITGCRRFLPHQIQIFIRIMMVVRKP